MPLDAYVGLMGAGKSHSAVEHCIIPALRSGRTVVTNIPLYEEKVREIVATGKILPFPLDDIVLKPESIFDYCPNGAVVVIDECWKLWPSGVKVNNIPHAFKSFITEMRHRVDDRGNAMTVALVVQDLKDTASFAREKVETTYRMSKLTTLGSSKRFRVDVFNGPVTGANPNVAKAIRQTFGAYDAKIYSCYKSHTLSDAASDGANEAPVDRRAVIWKRPVFMIGIPVVLGLFWFGFHMANKVLTKATRLDARAAVGGAPPVAKEREYHGSQIDSIIPQTGTPNTAHGSYRVVGWVENREHPEKSIALLAEPEKLPVQISYSYCYREQGQPLRCKLEGVWYSETGYVLPDVAAAPIG